MGNLHNYSIMYGNERERERERVDDPYFKGTTLLNQQL